MQGIKTDAFAVLQIPECKQHSVGEWGKANSLEKFLNTVNVDKIYSPYRTSYDRIIRGLAADFHELVLDRGIANLNQNTWDSVKDIVIDFIHHWIKTDCTIPVKKDYCHSSYYIAYIGANFSNIELVSVGHLNKLPKYINCEYGLNLTESLPELPENFYKNTVPYWEIENIIQNNVKLEKSVMLYCEKDLELLNRANLRDLNLTVYK